MCSCSQQDGSSLHSGMPCPAQQCTPAVSSSVAALKVLQSNANEKQYVQATLLLDMICGTHQLKHSYIVYTGITSQHT